MSCASSPPSRLSFTISAAAALLLLVGCDAAEADVPFESAEQLAALGQVDTVEPQALEQLAKSGKARLIDVRTDEEVAEGMIPGAEHIALDKFDPAKLDLSDGREPILYCRSGRRSEQAAEKLSKFTGEPTRHLKGGIVAWRDAGLPVVKPTLF